MKDLYKNTETLKSAKIDFIPCYNGKVLHLVNPIVTYYPENNKWQRTKKSLFYYGNVYAFIAWYNN